MTIPDIVNGAFEFGGAVVLLLNVLQLHRDKMVMGYDPKVTIFFTLWGFWNLYYYPHLNQWLSFLGGIFIVTINTIWLVMLLYYKKEIKQ